MTDSQPSDDRGDVLGVDAEATIVEPFGYPVSTVTVRAAEYGGTLGTILGAFTATDFRVSVTTAAVRFGVDEVQLSLFLVFALVLFAFGIRLFGRPGGARRVPRPVVAPGTETIALREIRGAPGRFAVSLLCAWIGGAAIAGTLV